MRTIRDPLYGYVEINEDFFRLIDTPEFQRLRNICQTGYQALYPSSLHNRFVHSIGVFHLGSIAIESLEKNSPSVLTDIKSADYSWPSIRETFIIACLLHDVGHSPFSHTGEAYYTIGTNFQEELTKAVNTPAFTADIKNGDYGKPHEAMSVLMGIDLCNRREKGIDKDLFARAIIGLEYSDKTPENTIKNAVINLLNGALIDVDKLDYIVRDAYVTGYSSLTIDLDRLLSSVMICKDEADKLCFAYQRKALSVIENVIYANDLERRWIQNHPVLLYDGAIVEYGIQNFNSDTCKKYDICAGTVFIKEALSANGLSEKGKALPIKLLCDDDIICYIKNENASELAQQFFSREARLKPLWKTEASFKEYSKNILGEQTTRKFHQKLKSTVDFIKSTTNGSFIIDDAILDILKKECEAADKADVNVDYTNVIEICDTLKVFQEENTLPDFKFAVIVTSSFKSAYSKLQNNDLKIELGLNRVVALEDVLSVRAKEANTRDDACLFYIYTTENNIQAVPELGYKFMLHVRKNFI